MNDIAIKVEGLGKLYRIGKKAPYRTLRESLTGLVTSPLRRLGMLSHPEQANGEATFWALKDVSFEVKRGSVVGIIGRNGAGKSTLLKILSRITEPTEGQVEINGRVGSLLEVGTGFHPELTGRENVYLNGAILGMTRAEISRKFDEIVAFAETEKFLDTPVKHYSSGMYTRLAFAVAAHLEPEILIVDEVLAVGDVGFQKKCMGKMGEVAEEGRTVLFVSHNMGAIGSLCHEAIELKSGHVMKIGRADDVVNSYLAAGFNRKSDDLEPLRYSGHGHAARFIRIELQSSQPDSIPFGDPIQFRLTVEGRSEQRDLTIGGSIFDTMGNCVGTLFTEQSFSLTASQQVQLNLSINNIVLAPGSYHAGFSIGRGGANISRDDLDVIIGVPTFQVLPLAKGDGPDLTHWHRSWGPIVFQSNHLAVQGG